MSQPRNGLIRESLLAVPRYRPGRAPDPADTAGPGYKLSSNENPYPPVAPVLAAIARAVSDTNRYPDMFAAELIDALAASLDVPVDCVAVGTGSVGVLGQIVAATCEPGDEVVTAWRSFEAYPVAVGVAGARAVQVPLLPDGRHDLAGMAAAVTEATRLVIVCTPNNPTGPAVHHRELAEALAALPDDVCVVIDEAYVEFVRDPLAVDALALARTHDNVIVLRTFSKAHGLAALRVGYAVASPFVASALRATATAFGVSALAQAAAVAALGARHLLAPQIEAIVAERERVVTALAAQGWDIPQPEGNFVWFPLGGRSEEFGALCMESRVSVRVFPDEGVRVTIGEPAANDIVVDVAGRDVWRRFHEGALVRGGVHGA